MHCSITHSFGSVLTATLHISLDWAHGMRRIWELHQVMLATETDGGNVMSFFEKGKPAAW